MPSRRALLAALSSGFAAVAGCTTREGAGGSNTAPSSHARLQEGVSAGSPTTTTASPDADANVDANADVEVFDIVVRKAVRYESVMGSGGVLASEGQQYVVASVDTATERELGPSSFAFVADEEEWSPGLPETRGAANVSVAGHEGSLVGRTQLVPDAPAVLAFTVPSPLSASNPRIRFDGETTRSWSLPEPARERLGAPAPRFELDSLSAPASISQGDPLSVSLTVTNVSETSGRFLAALYWPTEAIADDDESHVLERVVEAGETTTLSTDIDTAYTTYEPRTVTLELRGHVSADREIRVENVTTPS